MQRLAFLGVWATAEKGGTTCFFLDLDDTNLLVDCGMNIVKNLKEIDVNPMDVENLLITHNHGDHVSSFPYYLFHRFSYLPNIVEEDIRELNLISKRRNIDKLFPIVKEFYSDNILSTAKQYLNIKPIEEDFSFIKISDRYKLTFATTKHPKLTSAFRLDDLKNNFSLTYSADTAPCKNIEKLAKGSNLLIHETEGDNSLKEALEGAHTTTGEVGKISQKANVDVLMSVHRLTIFENKKDKLRQEIKEGFNGRIIFPENFDSFDLESFVNNNKY